MTEELKPCPFCGNTDIEGPIGRKIKYDVDAIVECQCGASISYNGSSIYKVMEETKEKWNRRASPWVRVEDRLPLNARDVLIMEAETNRIRIASYCQVEKIWSNQDGYSILDELIGYWMPIPEIEK